VVSLTQKSREARQKEVREDLAICRAARRGILSGRAVREYHTATKGAIRYDISLKELSDMIAQLEAEEEQLEREDEGGGKFQHVRVVPFEW
jgi:hypothetical protein